jgi:hypothetical protein
MDDTTCDDSDYPALVRELAHRAPTCSARSPHGMGRMIVGETVPFRREGLGGVPWRFALPCEQWGTTYDLDICSPWHPRRRRVV